MNPLLPRLEPDYIFVWTNDSNGSQGLSFLLTTKRTGMNLEGERFDDLGCGQFQGRFSPVTVDFITDYNSYQRTEAPIGRWHYRGRKEGRIYRGTYGSMAGADKPRGSGAFIMEKFRDSEVLLELFKYKLKNPKKSFLF
ncbi:MAG: hypothetical protein AABX17_02250 [Nanoarchaeota archaeon]